MVIQNIATRYGVRAVRVIGSSAAVVVHDCAEAAASEDARCMLIDAHTHTQLCGSGNDMPQMDGATYARDKFFM